MGRQIRTKPDMNGNGAVLGGWLSGYGTYLWIGEGDRCVTTIGGRKLYRLAKAIVRQFESADTEQKRGAR